MSPETKSAGNARPTFYEVVLEGNTERTHGLLDGLRLGAGVEGRHYFSHEKGIVRVSLGEKFGRFVGLHASVCHVIADKAMRDLLKRHAKQIAADHGVEITASKRIRKASFEFEYEAFARKYGEEIAYRLRTLPTGLKIEGGEPNETIDEEARGVEAYTAAHHYQVEGKGRISGRIDRLIEARTLLDEHPLVQVEPIELKLG